MKGGLGNPAKFLGEAEKNLGVKILEFSKENKKILVSHTAIFKDEVKAERKQSAASTKKVMKRLKVEKKKSTLGDLDELSALKSDLEKSE